MYRAKVEAVSGTKVYAGGKWLTCIGNKPVHVGERVWTDGRCVYGNYQESQQPPVILPQVEEDIPILIYPGRNKCYTLSKKRLKEFAMEFDNLDMHLMINDKNNKVFLLDASDSVEQRVAYLWEWEDCFSGMTGVEAETYPAQGFIAANIKNGNLYSLFVKDGIVQVRCNEAVVKEKELKDILKECINICRKPPDRYWPHRVNFFDTKANMEIFWSFIEDDNNWSFLVSCHCQKLVLYAGAGDSTTDDWVPYSYEIEPVDDEYATYEVLVTNTNEDIYISNARTAYYFPKDNVNPAPLKFPLQSNYYFKAEFYSESVHYDGTNITDDYIYRKITVFTPDDKKIFTGIFPWSLRILTFSKVKGGYLLGVYSYATSATKAKKSSSLKGAVLRTIVPVPFSMIDGIEYCKGGLRFDNGLFLLKNASKSEDISSWEILSMRGCVNQRLRPMKKIKDWQNQIQKITIEV